MIFRTHIPNFCSGINPEKYEISSTNELLAIDVVKKWSDNYNNYGVPFYQYSQSKYGNKYLLIAEYKNEKTHIWWVVGYLSEKPELPKFEKSKTGRPKAIIGRG